MKSRARVTVALLALAAAGGVAAWHLYADRASGAGSWSGPDAKDALASIDSPSVRHARWTEPTPLAGEVDTPADETRATLSPDGNVLVFAVGKRGSNCELWIADVRGERFENPRPIDALDTSADETAPAFGGDALYFASDRAGGAGGLDLYRAKYTDGRFGPVERLDPGLQSAQDDTDPAPQPASGGDEIVFASSRAGTSHLFAGTLDPSGAWSVRRIDELCSSAADLEPAFTSDGRFLWFASQRDGSFDLFRAPRTVSGFGTVEKIDELDTSADERAPMPIAHGFEVLFARPGTDGALDILRAHSIELARIPSSPWSWVEIATLAALLLLALLAWLSDRWPALDTLYKCYLISLLLHLLLIWWLHHLQVEGARTPAVERGHKVRVHLEDRTQRLTEQRVERAGDVSTLAMTPAHASPAPSRPRLPEVKHELERPSSLSAHELEPAEQALPAAPAREPAAVARTSEVDPKDVSDHEARRATETKASPALALEPSSQSRAPTSEAQPGAPARARFGHAEDSAPRAAEGARAIDVSRTVGLDSPAMPRDSGRLVSAPREPAAETLSDRDAHVTPVAQPAPALALEASSVAGDPTSHASTGPARAELPDAGSGVGVGSARAIDVAVHPNLDAPVMPRSTDGTARHDSSHDGSSDVTADALSDHEAHVAQVGRPTPGIALEPRSFADVPASSADVGPARAALPSAVSNPARNESRAIDVASNVALDTPTLPRTSDETIPRGARDASTGELSDRESADALTSRSAPASPRPDMLVGLAEAGAPTATQASGPERAEFEAPSIAALPDQPPPLDIPLAKATDAPLPKAPERNTWKGTPYENRSGPEKERALRDHGGTTETEQAVARGLAYLARIQGKSGNWGPLDVSDDKYGHVCVGKTALATLAFLGAGHTHASNTQYSATVARALSFLMSAQDPESGHFGDSEAYSHGIATYALAEAYALTHDPDLESALRPAIAHIVAHQSHSSDPRLFGGWSYYYADDRVFDKWSRTSITAWQVMALESARLGGIEVKESVFTDAAKFLESMRDEDNGWYWYNQDPSRMNSGFPTLPASTPAAMFALSILGRDITTHAFDVPRRFVVERAPRGFKFTGETDFVARGQGNPYFWYYGTLAMFRAGGGAWSTWNEAMKKTLLPAQAGDGSWNPIDVYAKYARDDANDKSYTTALSVLSLEVYYRYYLPLLKVR